MTSEQMGGRILDQANEIAALKKALMIADTLHAQAVAEAVFQEQERMVAWHVKVQGEAVAQAVREYETALKSIAANTCCDRCQEAALVAQAALRARGPQDA
jgi:NMD protein affecting ribosome stability and mRNA decay